MSPASTPAKTKYEVSANRTRDSPFGGQKVLPPCLHSDYQVCRPNLLILIDFIFALSNVSAGDNMNERLWSVLPGY